jgi:PAS domain S-box-containing protein
VANRKSNSSNKTGNGSDLPQSTCAMSDAERLYAVSHDLLCTLTSDGSVLNINPAWEKQLGITLEMLQAEPIFAFMHPDDIASARDNIGRLTSGADSVTVELRCRHINGDYRWLQWSGTYDPDRRLIYGIAHDITLRMMRDAELRKTEALTKSMLSSSLDSIIAIDQNEKVIEWNTAAESAFGYARNEALGRPVSELIVPHRLRDSHKRGIKRYLATGEGPVLNRRLEVPAMRKDGSEFAAELTAVPIQIDGQTIFMAYVRDVTERKDAEERLSEGEERYRRLIETASEGIWLADVDYRTTYVNRQLCEMLGYGPDEMIGRKVKEFIFEGDHEGFEKRKAARRQGLSDETDMRYRRKDGSEIWTITRVNGMYGSDGSFDGAIAMLTDITERFAARQMLENSEARFRGVVENLEEGILITDFDDNIRYANSRLGELTGHDIADMIGRKAHEILQDPNDWSFIQDQNKDRMSGISAQYEVCVRRKNGSAVWIECKATPFRDSSGMIVGTLGAITDIQLRKEAELQIMASHEALEGRVVERTTELAQRSRDLESANSELMRVNDALQHSEQALREVEQRLRAVLANLPAVIFATDSRGIFTLSEGKVLDKLGLAPGQVVGTSLYDMYREVPETMRNWKLACRRQSHFFTIETAGVSFDISTSAICDESGTVVEVLGLALDVSDRRAAEVQLEAQRKEIEDQRRLLRNVIDTDPNIIFVKDRDGRFSLVNQAVADVYGVPVEELVGKTDADFNANADEVAHFLAIDRKVMDTLEGTQPFEEAVTDSSGNVRWLQTVKRPFMVQDGVANSVLGIAADITRLKQLQTQVIQSEKLAAIGELVAGVAHEINNPLAAIAGSAQLLELHEDEKVRQRGSTIRRMTDRATRIVRSLLTYAHGSGESKELASLNEAVQETLEICAYKIEKAGVTLELHLAEDAPLAMMKSHQIQQVILNLINNAEHAVRNQPDDRRTIIITTGQRLYADNKSRAIIEVSDSGCGIKPEIMSKIFDPFFTTKEIGEGTGLGLSLCHGIVESHEGELLVESTVGEGTSFTIVLPCATELMMRAA